MSRRRAPRRSRRYRLGRTLVVTVLAVVTAVTFIPDALSHGVDHVSGATRSGVSPLDVVPPPTATPTAHVSSTAASTAKVASSQAQADAADVRSLDALVAQTSSSSTSVAAYNVTTGARVSSGATGGMTTASIAKVMLLEDLLYQRARTHTFLSSGEVSTVTTMIENSDNDSADDTFTDIGGQAAVQSLEPSLGLSTSQTVLGAQAQWGLTTTSASQQLILLRNLVSSQSPLDASSKSFALSLMQNVESDQAWGVPVAATSGTPAVKNGWLAVDADNDLWAVNSLGVVTVDGDTVVIAALTQHDDTMSDGVARVQALARAAAAAVT